MHFAHNNSLIYTSVSVRGGTTHRLHISEYGKVSVTHPLKAKEIRDGGFPAVPETGCLIVESTAEGQEGEFYDISTQAQKRSLDPRPLMPIEWKFFFFAWWEHDEYEIDPEGVDISPKDHQYFAETEQKIIAAGKRPQGFHINLRKRAWYIATRAAKFSGKPHRMWPEHPSTPEEAWLRSPEGVIFAEEIAALRAGGRVRKMPHVSYIPVDTFWDIGSNDGTGIWLHQHVHPEHRFLFYIEDWFKGYSYFTGKLNEIAAQHGVGWTWGTHYLPHDAAAERQDQHRTASPRTLLQELQPTWRFEIVPRIHEKKDGHEALRRVFGQIWIDPEGCKEGLTHLENYRYRKNTVAGGWMDEPVKNTATEAADSLMQFGQAYDDLPNTSGRGTRVPNREGARRRAC
jgi:hypothetical protein